MSAIIDEVEAGTLIEYAKNATGNRYGAVLVNEDDPDMPHELMLKVPAFVEVIFTRPDGVQVRKRGLRPTGNANLLDDNEIYYVNKPGDGVNDMHGLWRYTVAAVLAGDVRVRSKESVRWYCVRGDPSPVRSGDAPA